MSNIKKEIYNKIDNIYKRIDFNQKNQMLKNQIEKIYSLILHINYNDKNEIVNLNKEIDTLKVIVNK